MAWNGLGFFSIGPNETLNMSVQFGDAAPDRGPLYFSAHPLEPGGPLVSARQSKRRDAQGRTVYGFQVTNRGPNAIHFNVQGGGFINTFERDAGGLVVFGDHEDHGAQFCSATPLAPNDAVTMASQTKVMLQQGKIAYGYVVQDDPTTAHSGYRISGGGFTNGFNKVGDFTLVTGETIFFDGWWFPPDAGDHGAQYFAADPDNAFVSMTMAEQSKSMSSNGRITYGFSLHVDRVNPGRGELVAGFSVQGGGFV
jgi:hypothetical protein